MLAFRSPNSERTKSQNHQFTWGGGERLPTLSFSFFLLRSRITRFCVPILCTHLSFCASGRVELGAKKGRTEELMSKLLHGSICHFAKCIGYGVPGLIGTKFPHPPGTAPRMLIKMESGGHEVLGSTYCLEGAKLLSSREYYYYVPRIEKKIRKCNSCSCLLL